MTCLRQRLRRGKKSPVREPKVFIVMNTTKSTSRRQGRLREEGSEGSRRANVRADGQKPHTRLSPRASWHNTTKPTGSWGRVNAAVVHGKFTFLSGEICLPGGRKLMSKILRSLGSSLGSDHANVLNLNQMCPKSKCFGTLNHHFHPPNWPHKEFQLLSIDRPRLLP